MEITGEQGTVTRKLRHFVQHLAFCYRDNKIIFWKSLFYLLSRAVTYPIRHLPATLDGREERYQEFIKGKQEVLIDILGNKMLLPTADSGLTRDVIIDGIRERNSVEVLHKEYHEDMNTIDIGANLGYYVLLEAKLAKAGKGQIYAIEPNPHAFVYLQKNIKLNSYKNITLLNLGVSDMESVLPFYISKKWNCSRFSTGNSEDDIVEVRNIRVATLDSLFPDKKIDFIRMDIEGYEFKVLRGATNLIRNNPQIAIFLEFHTESFNTKQREEIIDFLKRHNLRIKYFFTGHERGARMALYRRGYKDLRNARYTIHYLYLQGGG